MSSASWHAIFQPLSPPPIPPPPTEAAPQCCGPHPSSFRMMGMFFWPTFHRCLSYSPFGLRPFYFGLHSSHFKNLPTPLLFLFSFDLLCFSFQASSIACVDVFIALIESLTTQPVLKADMDLPGCDFVGRQSTPAQRIARPRQCCVSFYYCVGHVHSQHHLDILIYINLFFSLPYVSAMTLTQTPRLRWLREEAVARGAD